MGISVDPHSDARWQVIDHRLEGMEAITLWRSLRYIKCHRAKNGYLTMVELKPKTGKFHQLRRHMAWVCDTPMVGDVEYDGGGRATNLRGRGLLLCSNHLSVDHPFYNTNKGRKVWDSMENQEEKYARGMLRLNEANRVVLTVSIPIPKKFDSFIAWCEEENARHSEKESPSLEP